MRCVLSRLALLWLLAIALAARVLAAEAPPAAPPVDDDYYELLSTFVDTLEQIERNYVTPVDRRELMQAAIEGMLTKLDPHSGYIPPTEVADFTRNVESRFGGIGIQVTVEEGRLKVISPLVDTPGYRAGLAAGDEISEIEGTSTRGITLDDAVRRLKGEVGTKVSIKVLRAGEKPREVTITREIVRVQTVLGDRRKDDDSWNFVYDPQRKIGYIRITAFSRDTADELRRALEDLQRQGLKGLVLDLRFNPGGLLSSAVEVADLFLSDGRIVSTKGRNAQERAFQAHKAETFEGFPMAVLINGYSASASEIVSAALQDHKRAVLVGERTWGKGSVQNVIPLDDGKSVLKLTTSSYLRPNGHNIHRFPDAKDSDEWGVTPDKGFELKLTGEELARMMLVRRERDIVQPKGTMAEPPDASVDRQLQKALDHVGGELAQAGD